MYTYTYSGQYITHQTAQTCARGGKFICPMGGKDFPMGGKDFPWGVNYLCDFWCRFQVCNVLPLGVASAVAEIFQMQYCEGLQAYVHNNDNNYI